MKKRWALSVPMEGFALPELADVAREAERLGYTDAWSFEVDGVDGFTPLAVIGLATGMRIGKTHPDYAADPDEVHYYECEQGDSVFAADLGKPVPWPYGGWHLEAMDAHGAWIASAVDLARLVAAFDDPDHCPLLKPETFAQIFERPPGKVSLDDEGQPSVFVVEAGKAQQRRITVGLTNNGLVEVTAGLGGQEQVVVVGQGGLKSGNAVRIVELEAATAQR